MNVYHSYGGPPSPENIWVLGADYVTGILQVSGASSGKVCAHLASNSPTLAAQAITIKDTIKFH